MVQNAHCTPDVCSEVPVAARPPLIVNARGDAPVEPDPLDAHVDRLLHDVDRLRRERDLAAGLAQQAEITRELDELYEQIGRASALARRLRREAPVPCVPGTDAAR